MASSIYAMVTYVPDIYSYAKFLSIIYAMYELGA
jgi:hypothetical protein